MTKIINTNPLASNSQSVSTEPRLLSAKQAAKMLGVSLRTLDTYTREENLPRVKLRGRNKYDIRDVDAWIATHKICGQL